MTTIQDMKSKIAKMLAYDIVGAVFLGISIVCFTVEADFAPGGVNGLAVISNYLFGIPIGLATILINIPIVLFTYRKLGKEFFIISIKSMLICSFMIDYVICYFPVYYGSRLIASILAGITSGIGYSLLFNEGSSTGGTDFIIVAVKQKKPDLSFGLLVGIIDSSVVVLSVPVFHDIWSFVYGMIYTVVCSLALDATTKILKSTILRDS
nr:YitT family protein [Clostridia bacterium]